MVIVTDDDFEPLFGSDGIAEDCMSDADTAAGDGTYVFLLAPSPFGVRVAAGSEGEARAWLLTHLKEAVVAGLADAVEAGAVDVHVIPAATDGATFACRAEDFSGGES